MSNLSQRNAQILANSQAFLEGICSGIKSLGLNLLNSKKEISHKIADDTAAFLANGNSITYC